MCSSHPSLLSTVTKREHPSHDAASALRRWPTLSNWPPCWRERLVSSFIVLGIVAIWILVLVPMWLNRHDSDSASRSMDSFSTAMRVLSRRTAARADRRYLVMRRDDWGVTVDNEPDTSTGRRPLTLRLPVLRLPMTRRQRYAQPLSGRARLIA